MARVLGVGGVFFKAEDPKKLASWYSEHLGIEIHEAFVGSVFSPADQPPGGYAVWAPFAADTDYFDPSNQAFMFNLVVDDLRGALAQVAAAGAELVGEVDESELGMFGWFLDPEGNKVELWQPA
jgi:predicted enzyme related to lactoylglutathione lyase